jgi:hypothetical protein
MRSPLLILNIRKIWAIKPLLAIVTFATLLLFGCATGDFAKPNQDDTMTRNGFESVWAASVSGLAVRSARRQRLT